MAKCTTRKNPNKANKTKRAHKKSPTNKWDKSTTTKDRRTSRTNKDKLRVKETPMLTLMVNKMVKRSLWIMRGSRTRIKGKSRTREKTNKKRLNRRRREATGMTTTSRVKKSTNRTKMLRSMKGMRKISGLTRTLLKSLESKNSPCQNKDKDKMGPASPLIKKTTNQMPKSSKIARKKFRIIRMDRKTKTNKSKYKTPNSPLTRKNPNSQKRKKKRNKLKTESSTNALTAGRTISSTTTISSITNKITQTKIWAKAKKTPKELAKAKRVPVSLSTL